MTEATGWGRREFVGAGALLALVVGLPVGVNMMTTLDDDDAPTERQRAVLKSVSQTVLPRTGTAGAGDVGVGDFVILALAHGLDGTRDAAASAAFATSAPLYRRPDGTLRHVAWLEGELDRAAGGDWLRRTDAQRERLLAAFDARAYADGPVESPWRKIKGLILTGYYTSQIGGSRELQFELTPGRFDPAVPIGPRPRAFSSDWTAVDFG